MRSFLVIAIAVLAAMPLHADKGDIPLIAIGLPFAPGSPEPVASTHPLFQRVAVDDIDALPSTIGSSKLNFIAAAKRSSVNAGLRDTLKQMHMLVPDGTAPKFRLAVTWIGSNTPFRIATSNVATATLQYRLTRIDSNQLLFDREISTSAKGGGVDASMRDNGIVRAAIAANFASAANCLDRAAFGTAPADCALTPQFSVTVVRRR